MLIYVEPLDEKATRVFMKENGGKVGSPLLSTFLALLHMLAAANVWVFGRYGDVCGVMTACCMPLFFLSHDQCHVGR